MSFRFKNSAKEESVVNRQNSGQSRNGGRQHRDDDDFQGDDDHGSSSRQPPAATLILGRLRCVIWENESKDKGKWYSLTLTRSYRTGGEKGEWKQAATLGRDDCLVGAELLRLALHKIVELQGGR